MPISKECTEIGEKLLYSREYLNEALDMVAHAKRPEDVVSSELAKDIVRECRNLYREVELTAEEGMRLDVTIEKALDSMKKADYDAAISNILEARRGLLDLIFQKVVACELEGK